MQVKRPTSVYVLAIISFVYGGLLLACGVCGGAALAMQDTLQGMQGAGMPEKEKVRHKAMMEKMQRVQKEQMPNANLINAGQIGAQLVFAGCLIFGAFGLLKMRPWGRWLHLGYVAGAIAVQIAVLIYTLLVGLPAQDAMMRAMTEEMQGPEKAMMDSMMRFTAFAGPMAVVGALIWLIYPIAVLIILLLPSNSAAFRRASGVVEDEPEERRHDDMGDEYGWRRGE